jgi:hypothetical protein
MNKGYLATAHAKASARDFSVYFPEVAMRQRG